MVIVEDEQWIRQSLENILPWKEIGFEYSSSFKNGEEAYQFIMEHAPEMVLTDIRMPKMDGLTLIEKVADCLESLPKFIVISGYDDFEYAKKAIRHGVQDYILKPIDPDELHATVLKILEKLNIENIQRQEARKIKIKEYIYECFTNSFTDSDTRNDLGMDDYYYQIIFSTRPIQEVNFTSLTHREADDLLYFPIPFGTYYLYFFTSTLEEQLRSTIDHIVNVALKEQNVGISAIRKFSQQSLYDAYQEAEEGYRRSSIARLGIESSTVMTSLSQKDELDLLAAMKTADKQAIFSAVDHILHVYSSFEQRWVMHLQLYFFLGKYINQFYSAQFIILLNDLKLAKNNTDLNVWRTRVLDLLVDEILTSFKPNSVDYIIEAKKYIETHYTNPSLSLDEVSSYLNLSTPYLSYLFKLTLGVNFTTYVTQKRIEKAKELLADSKLNVTNISVLAGFNDVKYFIKVFKRETLYTPNHYRELTYGSNTK